MKTSMDISEERTNTERTGEKCEQFTDGRDSYKVNSLKQSAINGGAEIKKLCLVRILMIMHCVLACWRVVVAKNDAWFWFLCGLNLLIIAEGCLSNKREQHNIVLKILYRWRPCIAIYLITVLPNIWLLQIHRYNVAVASMDDVDITYTQSTAVVSTTGHYDGTNGTFTTTPGTLESFVSTILSLEDSTWIVVIQDIMIYILLFAVWLLDNVSHDLLSHQLIAFLASASDIMELYALFDESAVQEDFTVTCVVLGVWTVSFVQFVPVLHKTSLNNTIQDSSMIMDLRDSHTRGPWEIAECFAAILLQDGPFLCVRLFVVIELQLVSYSLVFFLIKNLLTLGLLSYRIIGLCIKHKSFTGQRQETI